MHKLSVFTALMLGLCVPAYSQTSPLGYYWASPGGGWNSATIPNGAAFSSPAIAVRSTGEADVVVTGPQIIQ